MTNHRTKKDAINECLDTGHHKIAIYDREEDKLNLWGPLGDVISGPEDIDKYFYIMKEESSLTGQTYYVVGEMPKEEAVEAINYANRIQ